MSLTRGAKIIFYIDRREWVDFNFFFVFSIRQGHKTTQWNETLVRRCKNIFHFHQKILLIFYPLSGWVNISLNDCSFSFTSSSFFLVFFVTTFLSQLELWIVYRKNFHRMVRFIVHQKKSNWSLWMGKILRVLFWITQKNKFSKRFV